VSHRTNIKYYLAAAVSLLPFVVYLPSLSNDFVNWDDSQYVTENPFIRSVDLAFFKWALLDFYASNWHPLTWISHALDYAIWGLDPMGHHLTNNILHTVNTFLVVLLVVRLIEAVLGKQPSSSQVVEWLENDSTTQQLNNSTSRFTLIAAGTTGLLFGLHPLHVESVAWIAERKDLLCALFYLLSVIMYMSYRSHKTYRTYFLTLCFFVLALLSKPMAVSLPVVLLILDWHPFQRIQSLKTLLAVVIEKLPFVALSLISSVLTILAQRAGGATELQPASFSTRLLVAAKSLVVYLWKMIMPLNLIPLYPYPKNVSLLSPEYFLPIVLVAGITVSCLLAVRRQRLWLSCWGYYVVTLVPVLGIIQVGYQSMADRYTYLPSLAPFLVTGLLIAQLSVGRDATKKHGFMFNLFCATSALVVIVSMSYATFKQTGIWKNSMALWTYVIEKEPSSPAMAYSNRASALNDMGKFYEAIEDYTKAISLDPSYARAYWSRGSVLSNIDQLDKAMEDLDKAIALEPSASAYYTRGTVFEKRGEEEKAIGDYERAIELKPSYAAAHFSLGVVYGKVGALDKAIDCFDKAIDISPNHSLAYGNRGLAYSLIGRFDKAVKDLDSAIELNKRYAEAYGNRGNVYLKIGQKEFAIRDFQKACELGDKEACNVMSHLQP
jgi:tetratricopeptide (TPR) repeat protein